MTQMETIITAILGLNATLVGALIWVVKAVLGKLSKDIQDNTKATHELRDYQIKHARTQQQTNETLAELLRVQKEATNG